MNISIPIPLAKLIPIQRTKLLANARNPRGSEMAVAFANISMAKIDMQMLDKGTNKPHV